MKYEDRRPKTEKEERGFTLIEMIVAVALFSVVMLVSTATLLSLVGANRKAHALQSVMNNFSIALDGMVRSVRMGSDYHCGAGDIATPQSCETGDTKLAFKPYCESECDAQNRWVYVYDTNGSFCGQGRLCKSENSGANYYAVTADDVSIDEFTFYVIGTTRSDTIQPKVVVSVSGTAGSDDVKTKTTFSIQATAVQRILDI
ncbi:type II secretion system protein [Candidatus Kaiserbacteria bacterium]|nr:type II secretion system protein [Candidatus Kaiserbacteria bacterium]